MNPDSWKRPSAVDDAADVMCGYEQQLEFNFKPAEATPDEFQEWQEKELDWWADKQLVFVAIASLVQLSALGFMFMTMFLIGVGFK